MLLTFEQIISDFRERSYGISEDSRERLPILSDSSYVDTETQVQTSAPPQDIVNHEQNASIRVIALIMALSIHSVFEGIAIGVQSTTENVLQVTKFNYKFLAFFSPFPI